MEVNLWQEVSEPYKNKGACCCFLALLWFQCGLKWRFIETRNYSAKSVLMITTDLSQWNALTLSRFASSKTYSPFVTLLSVFIAHWTQEWKEQTKAFPDNVISPERIKEKEEEETETRAGCVYLHIFCIDHMNKTPANRALSGQFKWNKEFALSVVGHT